MIKETEDRLAEIERPSTMARSTSELYNSSKGIDGISS
jgi:hypothetical protein